MVLGPLIGGVLIGMYGRVTGIKFAFIVAFAMGALAPAVIQVVMEDEKKATDANTAMKGKIR